MAIITLTTDFGTDDEYAGMMKAAILSIDTAAIIVDITHGIDAQDVVQGAFMIDAAFGYFPKGTVHIVVVDPGVGTDRSIIGAKMSNHFFVAPDNGILGLVLAGGNPESVVRLENSDYFLDRISSTFHGRDIMAPVAAHIGCGVPLSRMGSSTAVSDLVVLNEIYASVTPEGTITGRVITIDRFGNLVTNINVDQLRSAGYLDPVKAGRLRVVLDSRHELKLLTRYADADPTAPLALIGSRGYLEIAVNCGSAQAAFSAENGVPVLVNLSEDSES